MPDAPPWRRFRDRKRPKFEIDQTEIDAVNGALFLRRPLLVTGKPGTGKSSLAYAVARELKLGNVLVWPITSRSTLIDALYRYDAIGRLQDANLRREKGIEESAEHIGRYFRLGPLGTALLPSKQPRVLLIDEIDKSDIDLPNDLLNIFEEGEYEIPELARLSDAHTKIPILAHDSHERVLITEGKIACEEFPFVLITSNGERELPPAFLRRCLRLDIEQPNREKLARIVRAHFAEATPADDHLNKLIQLFEERRTNEGYIATDQLLNAVYLLHQGVDFESDASAEEIRNLVLRSLEIR
ncbi:MAG: MoxR family ATPase [Caldilineaceae bacterium]